MSQKNIKIDSEYLDVLDENGKPTGLIKSKDDIHRDGDWHGTVQIWLINSTGKILLQKRSMHKTSRPGKWDNSCAGHIGAGESAICAAIRELKEELSLDIGQENLELLYTSKMQQIEKDGAFINHQHHCAYLAKIDIDIDSLKLNRDEVEEVKFIHQQEVEQHFRNKTLDFDFYPSFYTDEIDLLFPMIKKKVDSIQ